MREKSFLKILSKNGYKISKSQVLLYPNLSDSPNCSHIFLARNADVIYNCGMYKNKKVLHLLGEAQYYEVTV
jgi:hypothetical protein